MFVLVLFLVQQDLEFDIVMTYFGNEYFAVLDSDCIYMFEEMVEIHGNIFRMTNIRSTDFILLLLFFNLLFSDLIWYNSNYYYFNFILRWRKTIKNQFWSASCHSFFCLILLRTTFSKPKPKLNINMYLSLMQTFPN